MNLPDRAVLSDDEIALLIFSHAGTSSLTGDMARRAIATIWALQKERDQIRQTLEGIVADKYPAPPNLYLTELQRQLKAAIQRFDDAEETIRRLEGEVALLTSKVAEYMTKFGLASGRAEAAEGRVRELEKFLDYTVRSWLGEDEHRHCNPNECPHGSVSYQRFEQLEAQITPATGEGA